MGKLKKLYKQYHEVIMYLIFGVATTLVNFIATFGLQSLFGLSKIAEELGKDSSKYKVLYLIANIIAWFIAVLFAFVTNKKYVFESRTEGAKAYFTEMGKFFSARVATGVVENVLPSILMAIGLKQSLSVAVASRTFTFEGFWAKAITAVFVIILNYVFSKLFVFRKKEEAVLEGTEEESLSEGTGAESASEDSDDE